MSVIDEVLRNNAAYADRAERTTQPAAPALQLAVLACMDARMDLHRILGLQAGDAHVIRNAGGSATDDALRSLLISQHVLGTREVMLIHHTKCGMLGLDEDEVKAGVEREAGAAPSFDLGGFPDLEANVRSSVERIRSTPYLRFEAVRGFVYDVTTRGLTEVT